MGQVKIQQTAIVLLLCHWLFEVNNNIYPNIFSTQHYSGKWGQANGRKIKAWDELEHALLHNKDVKHCINCCYVDRVIPTLVHMRNSFPYTQLGHVHGQELYN